MKEISVVFQCRCGMCKDCWNRTKNDLLKGLLPEESSDDILKIKVSIERGLIAQLDRVNVS